MDQTVLVVLVVRGLYLLSQAQEFFMLAVVVVVVTGFKD
jgi:hypothetical protein